MKYPSDPEERTGVYGKYHRGTNAIYGVDNFLVTESIGGGQ